MNLWQKLFAKAPTEPGKVTLFLTKRELPTVSEVQSLAYEAKVEVTEILTDGAWKTIVVSWPKAEVRLKIPSAGYNLSQQKKGIAGYLYKANGEEMSAMVYDLILRTQKIRHAIGCVITPTLDPSGQPAAFLKRLARQECALTFLPAGCADPEMRVFLRDDRAQIPIFPSARQRKERSEALLHPMKVPVLASLPVITTDEEVVLREPKAVAQRAIATMIVAMYGEGLEHGELLNLIQRYEIMDELSPAERGFVQNPDPTEEARIQFCWRYECLHVLLWALGLRESLGFPDTRCDAGEVVQCLLNQITPASLDTLRLRPTGDILDAADLLYRIHWAIRNAEEKQLQPPAGLDHGITQEWHYALNWLISDDEISWDKVETNT